MGQISNTEVWGGPPVAKCVVGNLSQTDTFEEPAVQDQFEVTLEDSDLLGEVELTTELIIAPGVRFGPTRAHSRRLLHLPRRREPLGLVG
jgi:hypothetical protein